MSRKPIKPSKQRRNQRKEQECKQRRFGKKML